MIERNNLAAEQAEHELLLREEPDLPRLQAAYALLSTNTARGLSELEELATGGSVLSMLYLASAYKREPHADPSKTEYWYKAAYEKGALNSFSGLGTLYYRQGRYKEAEKVFAAGVARNDEVSMHWLARIYIQDRSHQHDFMEIKDLLERSMTLGQIRAKNQLAFLLMRGRYGMMGIPRGVFLYLSSLVDGFRVGLRNPDDRRLW
jgi:tetratricopeptide (TPR) repeat protein